MGTKSTIARAKRRAYKFASLESTSHTKASVEWAADIHFRMETPPAERETLDPRGTIAQRTENVQKLAAELENETSSITPEMLLEAKGALRGLRPRTIKDLQTLEEARKSIARAYMQATSTTEKRPTCGKNEIHHAGRGERACTNCGTVVADRESYSDMGVRRS